MSERKSFNQKLNRVAAASLLWTELFLGGCANPNVSTPSETTQAPSEDIENLRERLLADVNFSYTKPEILQLDNLFILYDKADEKLTPELLELYSEALKNAYDFVTQKLDLKFPNLPEGKLPVVFNGPSVYDEYLYGGKVGTIETVPEENPQYPCHANPVLYYQVYEDKIDQETLTGSFVHELIHAYLRNTVGPRNEHHFLEVGATCNDNFLMEEAFANLAQYLYGQEIGILNFEENYPEFYDDTNAVFRSQNFFPHAKAYGLWGFLADQIILDPSMPDYREFGQSLEAITAEGLRRQQAGEQANLDNILFRFLQSKSPNSEVRNANSLNQAILFWQTKMSLGNYEFPGGDLYEQILRQNEENIFPEEIDMANGNSILVTDMNRLGDFQSFNLKNVPQDQYVKVSFSPDAFSLVAINEQTGEIFANLNIFESEDGSSHEIHLPPRTTQLNLVGNGNPDTQEGRSVIFTLQ